MIENKPEKAMKPVPVPLEEFETFPRHVEEFFDLVARRPFELLEKRPFPSFRELEHLWKPEPGAFRPVFLKLYETEENLVVRAEVPGYTEKELTITCEPCLVISCKKEYKEEFKSEKKEEIPIHTEKALIYKAIKSPAEIKPDNVKAVLKNGILEVTLPKAEVVKKLKVEVKTL